ncbi:MAG TPA: DUF4349 domain-containing protein [Firmicutes bacterium]|nr:DUF4349 domain-containing protein [Bacillota bacterium]
MISNRYRGLTAILSFAALAIVVACGNDDGASAAKSVEQARVETFAARAAMNAPPGRGGQTVADTDMFVAAGQSQPDAGVGRPNVPDPVERKLIRHANATVEVDSVDAAIERLVALASELGGYVSSQNRSLLYDERLRGSVTLRIPGTHVDETLDTVRELGRIRDERVWVDDVTEEYYDLSIRLDNARDERGKLREILERARTVEDLLKVQRELSRVTGEIERMTGRMRRLTNQIEFSTITVEVVEKPRLVADTDTAIGKIVAAFRDMVDVFWSTIAAIIRFVGVAIPIVIVVALVVWILVVVVRKWRRKP